MVLGCQRIDPPGLQLPEARMRRRLVRAHEARVTDGVGGQNCRKPAFNARHDDSFGDAPQSQSA
jgi:hypothetical protein